MSTVRPFQINVDPAKVDGLKHKLASVCLPDEVKQSPWSRGPPLSDVQRLVLAWKAFDWPAAEDELNQHGNFQAAIDVDGFGSLDIHFIRQRSSDPNAIPLLFIHGWPGSYLECLKLKSLLSASESDPDVPHFHLVAPSLPNFGFSSGVTEPGFGLRQYAETLHKLMLLLGYEQYATQSGDWGYWIARAIGHTYPSSCLASHYNMIYASAPKWTSQPLLALRNLFSPLSASEKRGQERTAWFAANSRAYNVLQSTKPQTLGFALADSPVGLLAWIWEKLHDWSDDFPWSDEELLMFASVYWFSTAGPAATQNIYYEVSNDKDKQYTYMAMLEYMPMVNIGLTYNQKEIEIFPKTYGKTLGNVVYEVENDHGGHFYAHEHPELLLRDLHKMFGKTVNAFKR